MTFSLGESTTTINVISNLSVEPAGAFMAARDIIADEINENVKQYGHNGMESHFKSKFLLN